MANGTTRFAHKYDSYFCALPKGFFVHSNQKHFAEQKGIMY